MHRTISPRRATPLVVLLVVSLAVVAATVVHASAAPVRTTASAVSVRSGAWSDPNTWAGGLLPADRAAITVAAGTDVTLDGDARITGANVAGTLTFDASRSVSLLTDRNVVVTGTLTMSPVSATTVHRLRFVDVDNTKFIGNTMGPVGGDVGLWVMGAGRLALNGAPKAAWTRATGAIAAGQSSITLANMPTGWRAGDEVFVAPTAPGQSQDDKQTWQGFENTGLAAVAGNTVTLAVPAKRAHPVVNNRWTAEVGNLERNVKIEGTPGHYSHIFVRSTSPQTIRYAQLSYLGVFNKLGRYPLHFHQAGNGSVGSTVTGVVVMHSMGHAFVPHASNGVTLTDTIAYDITDDAYWWDVDNKASKGNGSSGITIDHAIAANVHGPAGPGLTGFRFGQGEDGTNRLVNSVATGVDGGADSSGFAWKQGSSAWTFRDNVAHNNRVNGIFVWQNDKRDHAVDGFAAYYNKNGILHGAYKNQFTYRDIDLYGNRNIGLRLLATATDGTMVFDRLRINGAGIGEIGIAVCCHQLDGTKYPTKISNCTIENNTGVDVQIAHGMGKHGNRIEMSSCTLTGAPYWVYRDVPSDGTLDVRNAGEHYVLRSASTPGATFVPAWNAWRTNMP